MGINTRGAYIRSHNTREKIQIPSYFTQEHKEGEERQSGAVREEGRRGSVGVCCVPPPHHTYMNTNI
jgi:hypothetical protein